MRTALAGVIAGAALLFSAEASADFPTELPPGMGGLWFGESLKSVSKKCEKISEPTSYKEKGKKITQLMCQVNGTDYLLSFDPKLKVRGFAFAMTKDQYDDCARQVLNTIGLQGRSEDKAGNESWGMNYYDDRGVMTGWVMCLADG